jgi:LysM repeat protein
MTRIISVLFALFSSLVLVAHAAPANEPLELAPDAPSRHVVVPGDTLWGISGKFLKDPYRWNELWQMNTDEVKNPHRIYPGQVLLLDTSSGQPRLTVEGGRGGIPTVKVEPQVRVTEEAKEIAAIPQQVIEPFLSQPLIAEADALEKTPRIVATQEGRLFSAVGDVAYVTGIEAGAPRLWQVYRPGKKLIDPVSQEVLGYEAIFLGSVRMEKEGNPATVRITSAREEIGKDDRLVPAPRADIVSYPLHKPSKEVSAHVVSVYGGSAAGGRYSIIALSAGKKDGVQVGHVLDLSRTGVVVTDRYRGSKQEVTLPDQRYGLLYVFRTFDRVSYALVMEATQPVEVGDTIGTP